MNIEKLQKLINSDGRFLSPKLKQRIMENKMTIQDIKFMESTIMSTALLRIKQDLENLVPSFQVAWMNVKEQKLNGETDIDIDYVLGVLYASAELLVKFSELTDDFGLADVVAVEEAS